MITSEHLAVIEDIRPKKIKKANIKILRDIYAAYTGTYVRSCFCSAEDRENFYNLFFNWYDDIISDNSSNLNGGDEQV
jgi:hypothetical protein